MSRDHDLLLLVDASPYIFRSFFALPSSLRSPDGEPLNAVHGFASFLVKLLGEQRPTHVAVAFDGSLTTSFRNEIYPDYKANRELPPEDLVRQLERCRRTASALGLATDISDRYEADDLIASWLERLAVRRRGLRTSVVTSDKDLGQLVGGSVDLLDAARDERWDEGEVRRRFGVGPEQIADYLALAGDPVDNIPGVAGVGPKSAVALLSAFGDLESALADLEAVEELEIRGARALRRRLEEGAESARLSRRLALVAADAPVTGSLEDLRWRGPDASWDLLSEELGFGGLGDRGRALRGEPTAD